MTKIEKRVGAYLAKQHAGKFLCNPTLPWCKTSTKSYKYDFVPDELKIIIEVDGPYHFQETPGYRSLEDTINNDIDKEELARENGYQMIRMPYTAFDGDWQRSLSAKIRGNAFHVGKPIHIIDDAIYDQHVDTAKSRIKR